MRQLEERQVDRAITDLLWSPKMDILAVVSDNNDISLFRLNWQKASADTGSTYSVFILFVFAYRYGQPMSKNPKLWH